MKRKNTQKLAIKIAIIIVLLLSILFVLPLPFIAVIPGTAIDLANVVPNTTQSMYALSNNIVLNPNAQALNLVDSPLYINPYIAIRVFLTKGGSIQYMPSEIRNISFDVIANAQAIALNQSILVAQVNAGNYIGKPLYDVQITFHNVSGPSGSLMTALQLVQNFGSVDLVKNRTIAGTGELDSFGNVKDVGGVAQKLYTAKDFDIIIVPATANITNPPNNILYAHTFEQVINELLTT